MKCCNGKMLFIALCLGFLAFSQKATSQVQVPRTLSLQGALTNSFDSKFMEGSHIIKVGIYESALGGFPLFEQRDTITLATGGLYNITLGRGTGLPAKLTFDRQYFVDIAVDGIPQAMRIPMQSAPYSLMAANIAQDIVSESNFTPDLREKLFPTEIKKGDKTLANTVLGYKSVIAGGDNNSTLTNYNSILGGYNNRVTGGFSTIGGGEANTATGQYSFVGGGKDNKSNGDYSSIVGGLQNQVLASGTNGIVGGGSLNTVSAMNAAILGGRSNNASGISAVIVGGEYHRATMSYAFVGGGSTNTASGGYSSVLGGINNINSGQYGIILGGQNNTNSGQYSMIAAGNLNKATNIHGIILSGESNQALGNYAMILGGKNNKVTGSSSSITSGDNHSIDGNSSNIGGGFTHIIKSTYASIGGGRENILGTNSDYSSIQGGMRNTISNSYSMIVAGQGNIVNGQYSGITGGLNNIVSGRMSTGAGELDSITSDHSVISGGYDNAIIGASSIAQYSVIGGGRYQSIRSGKDNTLSGGSYNLIMLTDSSAISGGSNNRILTQSDASFIGGGINNTIQTNALLNTISGGIGNTLTNTDSSTIGGGASNSIVQNADGSTISGGVNNTISDAADYGFIGGGRQNNIAANGQRSVIVGGYLNDIADADYGFIGGGNNNNIGALSNYSVIVSGNLNDISGSAVNSMIGTGQDNNIGSANYAFIGSGNTNNIGSNSTASFIGSGEVNDIGENAYQSVIVGGNDNDIATGGQRSAIVGGYLNDIADADYAFIAAGQDNNIAANANYSAIVGGSGNNIASTSTYSFIGGGGLNTTNTNDDYVTVVGGYSNGITGDYSTIVGGNDNTINGSTSFVGGGQTNIITGNYGTVGGGQNNQITTTAQWSTIAGGKDNTVTADYSTASGNSNTIGSGATYGVAIGNSNQISASVAATYGVAIGNTNRVTGTQGVAIGYNNEAAANAMALGNSATAPANEFHAKYSEGFYFTGDGDASEGAANQFTATFTNTNAAGNGVNIKLSSQAAPTNANDFVRFTNSAGQTVGRIEGQVVPIGSKNNPTTSSDGWSTSDSYQREVKLYNHLIDDADDKNNAATRDLAIGIAKTVAEAVEVGVAWADVGGRFACGWGLFSIPCVALGGTGIAIGVAKIATIVRMALDVVQYSMNFTEANQGLADAKNLRKDWACDRYSNQGVTYESGAADYAEWLPKTLPGEKFVASDIVGIKDGKISKNTIGADHCMVISTKPIVLGNTPEEGKDKEYEKVAFMGQVPVRVIGKVALGDYILPSGKNNGLGIARKPKDLSPYEYRKVVGVAWSAGDSPAGFNVINVAVGMNHKTTAQVIEEQTDHIVIMEKELDQMQSEIKSINDALITVIPTYKEVRGLESNGTLIELFKGLDFDQPKVVSARKLKKLEIQDGIISEQKQINQMDVQLVPQQEVERGYLEARQKFIDAGGDPEADPFYSRMERDPKYREIMLQNINRMINKSALEAQTKEPVSKPKN